MADQRKYVDLTLEAALARGDPAAGDPKLFQRTLSDRLSSLATEMALFKELADRFDALYFTTTIGPWGPDLWADDPSATVPGRSHISVNTPAVYVDIPAALQAVEPIENMLATEDSDASRKAANHMERVRKAWKAEEKWQLKRHKAATIKGLFGRTASFVYYDKEKDRACADVIENPRNLWIGYQSDDYTIVEWAAHVVLMDPNAVQAKFSVEINMIDVGNSTSMPWVVGIGDNAMERPHGDITYGPARVEVWDYWYRLPAKNKGKRGEPTKMETWNVVVAGNEVVRGPFLYKEYKGRIPYVPLINTFIPGTPFGRSYLHDMENLIREKMTRITAGAQMIAKATAGDMWQLIGQDAPLKVPAGAKPKLNEVATPGGANRIEAIAPFVAEFQLEQFFGRLDREMAIVSGLNDLLLGLAPASGLNSSKAVNALIAQYESRMMMSRLLYYTWDRDTWYFVVDIWAEKDARVKIIKAAGGGVLDIEDPSLNPKDEQETALRAANLVSAKLISLSRGMGMVGVDDPEQEQNIIREESTDATLFPDRVQLMAQLMSILNTLGLQNSPGANAQAQGQMASGQTDLRAALGGATPQNDQGAQAPEDQGQTPPIAGAAPEAGGAQPFARAQVPAGASTQLQTAIQGGKFQKNRITTQQPVAGGPLNIGRR